MKEKFREVLHIDISMPIILEECECHHFTGSALQSGSSPTVLTLREWREAPSCRYWGSVELEGNQLAWRISKGKESMREGISNIVILLKCQDCSLVEASSSNNVESLEEDYKDSELEDLLRRIENDAIRLNESQGKLKAHIVQMDATVCNKHLMEMSIIRGQEILGRFGSNFKKTPYGKLRVEINGKYSKINVQHELRIEHNAPADQKQHELGGESQDTNNHQNQMGWIKSLIGWIGRS
ncbi:disease resistance protein (TIR-NBS-LRR class) [Trifolium medium]|uniref:Disease resistance protein (TIR-NBS-LRR class) n=1 Tax=Trifolium medium TaxID=97028 RepID=A0A392M9S5_9FABA|nr:disease resistance protein (TIR-NBS-LRR class) [Trifolium medium]